MSNAREIALASTNSPTRNPTMTPTYPPTTGERRHLTLHGYNCTLQMGPYSINGYITIPADHPWLQGDPTIDPTIDVHGGITYHEGTTIGFDTNHSGDGHHPDSAGYQCAIEHGLNIPRGIPWSWEEVAEETERLAEQAREAAYYDTYLQITQGQHKEDKEGDDK